MAGLNCYGNPQQSPLYYKIRMLFYLIVCRKYDEGHNLDFVGPSPVDIYGDVY